jgi:hypothetical protein
MTGNIPEAATNLLGKLIGKRLMNRLPIGRKFCYEPEIKLVWVA